MNISCISFLSLCLAHLICTFIRAFPITGSPAGICLLSHFFLFTGLIQTKLTSKPLWVEEIQNSLNEWTLPSQRGNNWERGKVCLIFFFSRTTNQKTVLKFKIPQYIQNCSRLGLNHNTSIFVHATMEKYFQDSQGHDLLYWYEVPHKEEI